MTTQTQTLSDFLVARISDDEAWARSLTSPDALVPDDMRERFAEWSDRTLAECEAKRRIVDLHLGGAWPHPADPCDAHDASGRTIPCDTLRLLALPYADHPDYRDEWRP